LFRIQPVNPQKLIEVLQKAGFKVIRRKGSHVIMMDEKKTRIVVPIHPGREVKPGLVRAIIRVAGLTRDEFIKLLKE
jgi:predicted RNA binding protein YcfA (HicA-like mRNA interferase family)